MFFEQNANDCACKEELNRLHIELQHIKNLQERIHNTLLEISTASKMNTVFVGVLSFAIISGIMLLLYSKR